jgi:hypothetical protein
MVRQNPSQNQNRNPPGLGAASASTGGSSTPRAASGSGSGEKSASSNKRKGEVLEDLQKLMYDEMHRICSQCQLPASGQYSDAQAFQLCHVKAEFMNKYGYELEHR